MPMIRINAKDTRLVPAQGARLPCLRQAAQGRGPIIVMVHGYKYQPGHPNHCPHDKILSLRATSTCARRMSWPLALGFGGGQSEEGLGVAFGWNARGAIWTVQRRTADAGRALAGAILQLHRANPARPIHILAHSMGTEVAMEALAHLPAKAVDRIVSMTGACYQSRARAALQSDAGRHVAFLNITSRENDTFDFLYERLIAPPLRGDQSIGHGLEAANVTTLQIDCPQSLAYLSRLGHPLPGPMGRISHWSSYTRPGILRFYNDLFRNPHLFTPEILRRGLPTQPARRWSRLLALPTLPWPMLTVQRAS